MSPRARRAAVGPRPALTGGFRGRRPPNPGVSASKTRFRPPSGALRRLWPAAAPCGTATSGVTTTIGTGRPAHRPTMRASGPHAGPRSTRRWGPPRGTLASVTRRSRRVGSRRARSRNRLRLRGPRLGDPPRQRRPPTSPDPIARSASGPSWPSPWWQRFSPGSPAQALPRPPSARPDRPLHRSRRWHRARRPPPCHRRPPRRPRRRAVRRRRPGLRRRASHRQPARVRRCPGRVRARPQRQRARRP